MFLIQNGQLVTDNNELTIMQLAGFENFYTLKIKKSCFS